MQTADLSHDLAMALDPVCFAEAAGMCPNKWQRDVLRSRASRLLINASRQSGKSTRPSVWRRARGAAGASTLLRAPPFLPLRG